MPDLTCSLPRELLACTNKFEMWYKNANIVSQIENLQSFDPFEVLGVDNDASIRDIKKQYRRLSLEMHPDKNPDNPLAVQEFIRLTKAYNVSLQEKRNSYRFEFNSCS